ncbi:hypothetical protein Sango_0650900 [Sesamum angolense]|uniref:Reverse transcriptase domain-containing protein n=1 Tax=Sesamum angolense TaxID=2727404 RepID=A0AAE2C2A2_9LAMI|nr:hypothetical protein Sango_0650900 [Sesamum angolense]
MDASQGYHQIQLNPDDQKWVSFITSGGTYCYVVMPFGLKNTGATYQCLVDRMFREQLGRNMEVYVNNMLVKNSRAGVVLTIPEGDEIEYALHFDFNASNNEAEYEALIVGVRSTELTRGDYHMEVLEAWSTWEPTPNAMPETKAERDLTRMNLKSKSSHGAKSLIAYSISKPVTNQLEANMKLRKKG